MASRWGTVKRWLFTALLGFLLAAGSGLVQLKMRSPGEAIVLGWPVSYFAMGWAGRGHPDYSYANLGLDLIVWQICAIIVVWLVRQYVDRRRETVTRLLG